MFTIMSVDHSILRIRAYAQHKQWRPSRFAREAGLHPNSLRNMASDDWNPSAETLRKLDAVIPPDFAASSEAA